MPALVVFVSAFSFGEFVRRANLANVNSSLLAE